MSKSMIDSNQTSERGATIILVAASLLVMMGFAALAVDIGGAMNERRQDQSAADVGALAAAQFAQPDPGCISSTCKAQAMTKGANEAIAVANATLDNPAAANWSDASICGTPPTGFAVSPVSNCIAFDSNLERAWVRIPTIESPTYFGKVFGTTSISLSAEAIANTGFYNPGAVLPFLVPGNSASTDYNCLKTGPNPAWGECKVLPALGNFGTMDFFLYGNEDPEVGTTEKCSGDSNGRFRSNLARGIDHPLGIHPTGSGPGLEEPNACPILSAQPNIIYGQTGVGSQNDFEAGLFYGGTSYSTIGPWDGAIEDSSGYLVRNSGAGQDPVRVNNTPLWTFLRSSNPAPCDPDDVDDPSEMIDCIGWAKTSGTEIFRDDIITYPRFGFTPRVWADDFSSGASAPYYIKGYIPVYLDTTYFGCSSNSCATIHRVGVPDSGSCPPDLATLPADDQLITCGTPGSATDALMALSSYILDPDLLPEIAKTPYPGSEDQRRFNLSK